MFEFLEEAYVLTTITIIVRQSTFHFLLSCLNYTRASFSAPRRDSTVAQKCQALCALPRDSTHMLDFRVQEAARLASCRGTVATQVEKQWLSTLSGAAEGHSSRATVLGRPATVSSASPSAPLAGSHLSLVRGSEAGMSTFHRGCVREVRPNEGRAL